jgi:hypothetical protein
MFALKNKFSLPLVVMVIANIIPIIGVIFWGWDAFSLWLLYWSETLLLIIEGMFKLFFIKAQKTDYAVKVVLGLILILAFLHVMGLFGAAVLVMLEKVQKEAFSQNRDWLQVLLCSLPRVIVHNYSFITNDMKLTLIFLFSSHIISFLWDGLKRKTEKLFNFNVWISKFSWNIFIILVTVCSSLWLVETLGSAIPFMIIFVILKTLVDIEINTGVLFQKK